MNRAMRKIYYGPAHPGSSGRVNKLYRALKDEGYEKVNADKVRQFLSGQDAYTLHKPTRIHFSRNKMFVLGTLNQFQADLSHMQAPSSAKQISLPADGD